MAIKSKSFKTSFGLKLVAFFIAALLAFSSAICAVEAINDLFRYGSEILTKPAKSLDMTETSLFASKLNSDVQSIYAGSGLMTWDAYKSTYYSTFDEELSAARTELERFKKECMSEAVAAYRDKYAASEYSSSQKSDDVTGAGASAYTTNVYENVSAYSRSDNVVSPNYDKDYYDGCRESYSLKSGDSGNVTFSTSTTDEELVSLVSNAYSQVMSAARREYETTVAMESRSIKNIKNLKYYIYNPSTGEIITNLETETSEEKANEIKKSGDYSAFTSGSRWYMVYTADGGLVAASPQITRDTLYTVQSGDKYYFSLKSDYYYKRTLSNVLGSCFSNNGYDIILMLPETLSEGDDYYNMQSEMVKSSADTYNYIFLSLASMLVLAMVSVYLIYAAGETAGPEKIKFSFLDKLPTDLHFVLAAAVAGAGVYGILVLAADYKHAFDYYADGKALMMFVVMSLIAVAVWAVLLEWLCSVSKYYKAKKNWLRSTLVWYIIRLIGKLFSPLKRLREKPVRLRRRVLLVLIGYIIGNTVLTGVAAMCRGFWFVLLIAVLLLYNILTVSLMWKYVLSLDRIIAASENAKNGEPPENIYSENMPEPLKTLALNLSLTQEERQKAINEAVKGERMKTELITNVSHDLKTPLTSIISYVDLLKKCDIDDISAQKYINVLDEKSIRLKRLIEDLVEASKASSGAVTFNKMNVNLHELAVQAVGEMSDVFEERHLETVLNEPTEPIVIYADSQKTWRIIDNLLSNVKKYALPGTRVYIDVGRDSSYGTITIKNTSREKLNIDPDELTQRFVRGDESRTMEGSGLGLSIAKDLCTLQGGKLELSIDGDLFKATVKMPLVYSCDDEQGSVQ